MVNLKKILTLNILISLIAFVLLNIFSRQLVQGISHFLFSLNRPLVYLSVNPLDLLIIASIPVWTYPLYFKNPSVSIKQITFINVCALAILILACIVAFILLATLYKPESPLIPGYVVFMPFSFFQTMVLMAGVGFTYFLFAMIKLKKKN